MEAATTGSITELLKFGIAGVFIIALLLAVYTLWRNNLALTNQIAKLQEDRIADVRLCTSALVSTVFEFDSAAAPGTILTVHWQTTAGDGNYTIGGAAAGGINGATLLVEEIP